MINNITISPEVLDEGLRLAAKWHITAQQAKWTIGELQGGVTEEELLQLGQQCWDWLLTNANPYVVNAFIEYTQRKNNDS
jgi:hypothetical protein